MRRTQVYFTYPLVFASANLRFGQSMFGLGSTIFGEAWPFLRVCVGGSGKTRHGTFSRVTLKESTTSMIFHVYIRFHLHLAST